MINKPIKIAVVGDVHDQWEPEDEQALKHFGVDLVLFVGDFGNESVEIVRAIANVNLPKAVIFGNHDAWYTASDWGRKRSPYDHQIEDRVQQQLDLLGKASVGYGFLDFPELNLSVVGSRPFSWGGPQLINQNFYQERFGVKDFCESTAKIIQAVENTSHDTLIFLGHNGPKGLGDQPEDTCGRDWEPSGGDYGDPDLQQAISAASNLGKKIPLVTFGHMHHQLRHTKKRLRTSINQSIEGTIYFNSASVPRIITNPTGQKLRNFSLVVMEETEVKSVSLLWLGAGFQIISQQMLYSRQSFALNP